jgi:lysophospholipase
VTGAPPPACDREEELAVPGGTLHLEHFLAPGQPAGLVVFVHGFDAHCGMYRELGRSLADGGFTATLFDLRGHGRSSGRRGHVDRFEEYGVDLNAVVARARALTPGKPVTVVGHSMGGAVVLDALMRRAIDPPADRAVLAAPWLGLVMPVPWWKRVPSPLFARLWPTLTMGNGLRAADVSRNPRVVEARDRDPLVHHVASARFFEEVLAAQARIRAGAGPLPLPTLVLVVGNDKIVSTEATLTFARAAGATVAVRRYEALYHDLFVEPERDQVLADLLAWLRAPVTDGADLGRASFAVPGII